jgi:hypothetical protein
VTSLQSGSRAQRRFDTIVLGNVGRRLIKQCQPALDHGQEVVLHFCMRDVEPHTFLYTKGENRGKTGACLKSFLIRVYWIMVDGEYVYEAAKDNPDSADDSGDEVASDALEDWLP